MKATTKPPKKQTDRTHEPECKQGLWNPTIPYVFATRLSTRVFATLCASLLFNWKRLCSTSLQHDLPTHLHNTSCQRIFSRLLYNAFFSTCLKKKSGQHFDTTRNMMPTQHIFYKTSLQSWQYGTCLLQRFHMWLHHAARLKDTTHHTPHAPLHQNTHNTTDHTTTPSNNNTPHTCLIDASIYVAWSAVCRLFVMLVWKHAESLTVWNEEWWRIGDGQRTPQKSPKTKQPRASTDSLNSVHLVHHEEFVQQEVQTFYCQPSPKRINGCLSNPAKRCLRA